MFCTQCGKQNSASASFCFSCGNKLLNSEDVTNLEVPTGHQAPDKSKLLLQAAGCYFSGSDLANFSDKIAPAFGAKSASKLKYNIYCVPNHVILVPVSKDRQSIALWGLLLGTGGLAAGAMAALEGYASKLERRAAEVIHDKDNPFYEAVFFGCNDCRIVAKETRSSSGDLFDVLKKETWVQVEGSASYQGNIYKLGFEFGMAGQATDKTKKHITQLDEMSSYLGIPAIEIRKGKYP